MLTQSMKYKVECIMCEKPHVCACNTAPKLVFACSGAADVGAIADQAARKLP